MDNLAQDSLCGYLLYKAPDVLLLKNIKNT